MPILLVLVALVVLGIVRVRRDKARGDIPARLSTAAANRLPADRHEWGQAMIGELPEVRGSLRRWQFAAGVVQVALFPPVRSWTRVSAVALIGLAVVAAVTLTTARQVPSLTGFVAALALLVCGYAVAISSRVRREPAGVTRLITSAAALTGLVATVVAVVRVGVAHPAATIDHTHQVAPILFALVLFGYLAFALAPPRLSRHNDTALWWALASCCVWIIIAFATATTGSGPAAFLSPVGAAATLAAAMGASVTTGSRPAGAKAGILTAILSAPILFAINITAILQRQHYTLTDPYDISAFPHSGYPDVASYLISEALDGNILAGLVLYPVVLFALAFVAAAAGVGLRNAEGRPKAHTVGLMRAADRYDKDSGC